MTESSEKVLDTVLKAASTGYRGTQLSHLSSCWQQAFLSFLSGALWIMKLRERNLLRNRWFCKRADVRGDRTQDGYENEAYLVNGSYRRVIVHQYRRRRSLRIVRLGLVGH